MTHTVEGTIAPHQAEARRALLCFATAAAFEHYGAGGWRALDFASADLRLLNTGRAPLLAEHERHLAAVLGVVETAWVHEGCAFAVARFGTSPRALEAWALVAEGIVGNVSCGITFDPTETDLDAATEQQPQPVRNWRPFEVSLVAVPGNWRAGVVPGAPAEDMRDLVGAVEDRKRADLEAHYAAARRAERLGWLAEVAQGVAARLGTDPARTAAALEAAAGG